MKRTRAAAVWLVVGWACTTPVRACPPASHSRAQLVELREAGFGVADPAEREALALALIDCLSHPDPELRDRVAFEALSTWMRAGQLSAGTASAVLDSLLPRLAPEHPDPEGFGRPFSALVLAELARMDRMEPFLSPDRLDELVSGAARFLRTVDDYRGYDEREGWRHQVAHGADLVLQLSLNPRVGKEALDRMLSALALQVAPADEHFYVYGEPMRLARAVYYAATRGLVSDAEWEAWLGDVTAPGELGSWDEAFASQAGLAKRHNTAAFLQALYLLAREGGATDLDGFVSALVQAIGRVP